MISHAFGKRLLVLLLIFALQAQVLAAAVLPCTHADPGVAQGSVEPCPNHLMPSGDATQADPSQSRFDCQKCALTCIGSVYDVRLSISFDQDHVSKPLTGATPLPHFYLYIPDLAKRPPIAALS